MFTTLFDSVPGLQWDSRRGSSVQSVRRGSRAEALLEEGGRLETPVMTPEKKAREGRSWTAGTVSTRVPSSRGGTPAARSMYSNFSEEDERSFAGDESRTPIVAELSTTMAATQPILRHSGSAPSLTMKSTAVSLERALVEIHRLTGTPMHRTRAGLPVELANCATIGGTWTPRGRSQLWASEFPPWDDRESSSVYVDSFIPQGARPGTSPGGPVSGSSFDGLVSPLDPMPSGLAPFPGADYAGGEPEAEANPTAQEAAPAVEAAETPAADAPLEPAGAEEAAGEAPLDESVMEAFKLRAQRKAEEAGAAEDAQVTSTEEHVDQMKDNLRMLGIGVHQEESAVDSYVNQQFHRLSFGGDESRGSAIDGQFMFQGSSVPYEGIHKIVRKQSPSDRYDHFKELLQYWLGERVDPELFPEFPGLAARNQTGEWYECTMCKRELSLAHVFSQEHCEKMGRPWEEFNKHNPDRHIAARGSTERAPWRRVYNRAKFEGKKDRALHVREVYDREEWFKVAQGFAKPMSCGGIRAAKPSRHIRWGELGLDANPNLKYSKGKIV